MIRYAEVSDVKVIMSRCYNIADAADIKLYLTVEIMSEYAKLGEVIVSFDGEDGPPTGFSLFTKRKDGGVTISLVYVRPVQRMRGYGKGMLDLMLQGCTGEVRAKVMTTQIAGNAFFMSQGFEFRGTEPGKGRGKSGRNLWVK